MAQGMITMRDDYAVGATLDVSLRERASPFTDDSFKAFIQAFNSKSQTEPDGQGAVNFDYTLCQDQTSKTKALGVDGKLNFSYGPVSGDANVQFAMNNVQGSLDLTMVIRAHSNGRVIKNDNLELVDLRLRENVAKLISDGKLTFEQFRQQYGEWLIIGFEYGGQVLFKSTYSTKSSDDKMSVSGGLSLSYGKMGFNISGSVNGDYKSDDISKSTNITTHYTIFPSFDDELINGDDGIITLLEKISNPAQNGLDIDNGDEKEFGNLSATVESKIQELLSGKKLDKINCIVFPLSAVGCVNDAFIEQIVNANDVESFNKFANPLYMSMNSMLKGLEVINKNYDDLDGKDKPTTTINKWFQSLNKNVSLMDSINGAEIYKYAGLYTKALEEEQDEKEDDSAQIDKEFYKMDKDILQNEFNDVIMKPYNEMLKNDKKDKYDPTKLVMVALKSLSHGKYVSLGDDNSLMANADNIGTQTSFHSVPYEMDQAKIALLADNDLYTSALGELYDFVVVCDRRWMRTFEQFTLQTIDEEKQLYALKTIHNTYITVHDDGKIAADSDQVGDAEKFTITAV